MNAEDADWIRQNREGTKDTKGEVSEGSRRKAEGRER
jgi:hypothetical protein